MGSRMPQAANVYSRVTEELELTLLLLKLSPYDWPSSLVIARRLYKEANLPDFERYCIIISPPATPWEEKRIATPQVSFILRADLYLTD